MWFSNGLVSDIFWLTLFDSLPVFVLNIGNNKLQPRHDNKTATAVGVNTYAIDCKGQILAHVARLFHTFRQKHELKMCESHSCVMSLEKRNLEAMCK